MALSLIICTVCCTCQRQPATGRSSSPICSVLAPPRLFKAGGKLDEHCLCCSGCVAAARIGAVRGRALRALDPKHPFGAYAPPMSMPPRFELSGRRRHPHEDLAGSGDGHIMPGARTPKKAKSSAAARPSASERGIRGFPRLRHNTARPSADESRAQRPVRAQRRREARIFDANRVVFVLRSFAVVDLLGSLC